MSALFFHSRRLITVLSTWLFLTPALTTTIKGFNYWGSTWSANRSHIVILAAVNTSLTTATEFISRSISAPIFGAKGDNYGFFSNPLNGPVKINRQSLTNIWMTLIISLLGAPVYFFKKRMSRFIFFVSFGATVSVIAQSLSGVVLDGLAVVAFSRIIFDIGYTGTVKFFMFEYFRKPIIENKKAIKISGYRAKQDLITTFIRVNLLNLFGFKA